MSKPILTHLDFGKVAELRNGVWHLLNAAPAAPVAGQFYYDTGTNFFRGYHGAAAGWLSFLNAATRLDQIAAPTAPVAFNGQRITGLADPTAAQDAATRAYVDNVAQGLDAKASVVWTTTGNVALNGTAVQGGGEWTAALAAGTRLLLKNQTAPAENGLWVAAAGAWTRAADMDVWAEVPGAFVFVEQGAVHADTGWVSTADAGGNLGVTAVTWTQFSSSGTILGGAGLTKTGNSIDVVAAAGSGIVVNADNIDIDPVNGLPVNRGGTGAITATAARANLGVRAAPQEFTITGDGILLVFNVAHNLNSKAHITQVRESATDNVVDTDITVGLNTDVIGFAAAPGNTVAYKVVVA